MTRSDCCVANIKAVCTGDKCEHCWHPGTAAGAWWCCKCGRYMLSLPSHVSFIVPVTTIYPSISWEAPDAQNLS